MAVMERAWPVRSGSHAVGARADLAVLNADLATRLAADERLARVRSDLTVVGGQEVRRS